MDLILWRHAEAEYDFPDLSRRLTPKGEKQARRMAQWLHDRLPDSARIVSSPAIRTQQTAAALVALGQRKHKILDGLAPDANPHDVLTLVDWPHARQTVVVVGHQPTLGQVASLLLNGNAMSLSVKKGAIWWFGSRDDEDGAVASLQAVLHPGML